MVKNDENQNKIEKKVSLAKRLKRWLMWLVLLIIAAGGFYTAYLDGHLSWFGSAKEINTVNNDTASAMTAQTDILKEKVAALEDKVQTINREIVMLKNNTPVDYAVMIKNIEARLAQFEDINKATIKQIEDQLQTENSGKVADINQPTLQDVLLASGAMIVRDMAERGQPFAYEAEVLQILAQGNPLAEQYTAKVSQFAVTNIKGAPALIKEFDDLYTSLNDVPLKQSKPLEVENATESETWYTKAWKWFKNIAMQRRKAAKPEFKAEHDEVYRLVNAVHFAEALNLMKTDAGYMSIESPALYEWQKQAQEYVTFDSALQALVMNALANIHLKEMQH